MVTIPVGLGPESGRAVSPVAVAGVNYRREGVEQEEN
jgi:hypothetical protein